jgi:hypothetical protein
VNYISPIIAGTVALVSIAAATVAVVMGAINGEAFVAIVTGFGGAIVGGGLHASGASSGSTSTVVGAEAQARRDMAAG